MNEKDFVDDRVMRGFPPPPEYRVRLDQVYADPRFTHWYMQHAREVGGTADVSSRHGAVVPLPEEPHGPGWRPRSSSADGGPWTLDEMLRGTCADGDRRPAAAAGVVYERYFNGMRPETPHLCQSVTKALASCVAATLVEARQR